ncbi:hypothetical protein MSAN_02427900 [Mycena sanguinolenta]|uniref:Uncharacterized protein n=1 Tax=Mycena sanguinolenta TaxID=230812 RepID=A0A8H6X2K1_9AGAR|nr:hypothetical protein MSAN_02426100 [Mycena sanguinolenta]KAF7333258.1 hypothetical protein MSAN_02427900 [Mycena sanguinolenta]
MLWLTSNIQPHFAMAHGTNVPLTPATRHIHILGWTDLAFERMCLLAKLRQNAGIASPRFLKLRDVARVYTQVGWRVIARLHCTVCATGSAGEHLDTSVLHLHDLKFSELLYVDLCSLDLFLLVSLIHLTAMPLGDCMLQLLASWSVPGTRT